MITYDLAGKVAVITGGASGIGLACAHTMAAPAPTWPSGTWTRTGSTRL